MQAEESIELERRFLIGGGIRPALVRLGSGGVDLGVGLMLDEERRTNRDVRSDIRGANLLSIFGDAGVLELSGSIYFQPVIQDWDDHRVLTLVSLVMALVSHVSLSVSSFWRRDSRPPSGVEKHDRRNPRGIPVRHGLDRQPTPSLSFGLYRRPRLR